MHDSNSLTDTYRRHGLTVFRRARQLLGSEVDAFEVVQDVFLSLVEKPQQFKGQCSFTTFLYSVTTNACLAKLRNAKNRERIWREQFAPEAGSEVEHGLNPEQWLMLRRALSAMPEELAQVSVYYLADGLSHQEIARILDCSRRHVGDLLARVTAWEETQEATEC
jgi:RNA polymerase sigma-70 factor (ECF subfamily)